MGLGSSHKIPCHKPHLSLPPPCKCEKEVERALLRIVLQMALYEGLQLQHWRIIGETERGRVGQMRPSDFPDGLRHPCGTGEEGYAGESVCVRERRRRRRRRREGEDWVSEGVSDQQGMTLFAASGCEG